MLYFLLSFNVICLTSAESLKFVKSNAVNKRDPPPQPSRPPYLCLPPELQVLRGCYSDYFELYGVSFENGTFPHKTEKFFDKVNADQNSICRNYATFQSCESRAEPHCVTFQSIQILAGDESDALYYLQQLALIELYCDHQMDYIRYMRCLDKIDMNELQELVYEECELNIHDECRAVQKTVKCERGVVSMVCDAKQSLDSYCTYQNLQMRRAAWTYCYDMPCNAPSIFTKLLYILSFLLLDIL